MLVDDVPALSPQPGQTEKIRRDRSASFLRVLAPLGPDDILAFDDESRAEKCGFHAVLVHVVRDDASRSRSSRGFSGLEQISGEIGVHEHSASRLQHARRFGQTPLESLDAFEHVPAPDEVEGVVGLFDVLHDSLDDLDPVYESGFGDGNLGPGDVPLERVDRDPVRVVRLDEPDEVGRVPAADVEDPTAGARYSAATSKSSSGPRGFRLSSSNGYRPVCCPL